MGAREVSTRSKILNGVLWFSLGVTLFFAAGRYVSDPRDQSRCQGMLTDGWFLEDNYTNWQPAGCMQHMYKPKEIAQCLSHSRVLYIGDSIMREQYYSMVGHAFSWQKYGHLHEDKFYGNKDLGLTYEFWWDPYINSTRTLDLLRGKDPGNRPSLLVMGTGAWYMNEMKKQVFYNEWKTAVDRVFEAVQSTKFQIADAVLLSPVEIPQYNLLRKSRAKTTTPDKIALMNNYLRLTERRIKPTTPFAVPFVWNTIATSTVNVTIDGLHYLPGVTGPQAMLGLNFRCNEVIQQAFPYDKTCCYHYPQPAWYQTLILLFFLVWVPLGFYVVNSDFISRRIRRWFPSESSVLVSLFVFGLGIVYMYICDRTQLFAKAQKSFHADVFTWWMVAMAVLGLVTLKTKKEGDAGLLSRAQTDEWKGWMQIVILVYHFTGASQTAGIYNAVRILVAAYLFQTGYGHFYFFYKKGDFGLIRVLNVMVRLNLLTFVLQYIMNTNYISYYFTPLVSFWFGVIWLTMYIGHTSNDKVWFVLAKMAVAAVITGAVIHVPGILEGLFAALAFLFNIHWDAGEWRFRLALDAWIVYGGMLFAFASIKCTEHKMHTHRLWWLFRVVSILVSAVALVQYFRFELAQPSRQAYNHYQPYISWIPILAFIALRNATTWLRNTSSGFFEFIGKISLETFIGQFHMWLAADTKGLLVVLTDPLWMRGLGWWINLAISSVLFIFVSYHLNQTTGDITKWIIQCVKPSTPPSSSRFVRVPQNENEQDVPLLPTSSTHHADTADQDKPETRLLMDNDDDDDQTWQKPSRWQRVLAILTDLRVKTLLFLVGVGIINRFC